jgi:hypothetical protein
MSPSAEVDTLVTDSLLHPEARGLLSEQVGKPIIAAARNPPRR